MSSRASLLIKMIEDEFSVAGDAPEYAAVNTDSPAASGMDALQDQDKLDDPEDNDSDDQEDEGSYEQDITGLSISQISDMMTSIAQELAFEDQVIMTQGIVKFKVGKDTEGKLLTILAKLKDLNNDEQSDNTGKAPNDKKDPANSPSSVKPVNTNGDAPVDMSPDMDDSQEVSQGNESFKTTKSALGLMGKFMENEEKISTDADPAYKSTMTKPDINYSKVLENEQGSKKTAMGLMGQFL